MMDITVSMACGWLKCITNYCFIALLLFIIIIIIVFFFIIIFISYFFSGKARRTA